MPTTDNFNPREDKPQSSHLDKLLDNKPAEFQAKVLRFALDSEMKPDDPAFRLVQYIGYLSMLTETAPNEWKQLFKKLQGELSEWTELTAEQLAMAADQSEVIDNLAQSCSRLSTALNANDLTSQEQSQHLAALKEVSPSLRNVAMEIPGLLKLLTKLNQTLSNQQTLTFSLSPLQMMELKQAIALEIENRNLTSMARGIDNLAHNQRKMIGMLEQMEQKKRRRISSKEEIFVRLVERYLSRILIWIYNLDWQCIVIFTMILAFIAVPTSLVLRMNSNYQPATTNSILNKQVQDTYMQVNNANIRLQRIEEYLGTQPKLKSKKK